MAARLTAVNFCRTARKSSSFVDWLYSMHRQMAKHSLMSSLISSGKLSNEDLDPNRCSTFKYSKMLLR